MKTIDLVYRHRFLILLIKNVKALLFIINALCIWRVENKPFINLKCKQKKISQILKKTLSNFFNMKNRARLFLQNHIDTFLVKYD